VLKRILMTAVINIGAFCVMAIIMLSASIMVYVVWSYILPLNAI